MKIHEALVKAMEHVGAVGKEGRNASQNFNFRGIDDVVNAVSPAFRAFGIVSVPQLVEKDYREVTSANGKRQVWVLLTVRYTFTGPEGDTAEAEVPAEATDFADKATAKAMSVAFRTALLQVLALPTDDIDPDEFYEPRGEDLSDAEKKRQELFDLCKSKQIGPEELKAQFAAFGGKGLVSECEDLTMLADLVETFEAA